MSNGGSPNSRFRVQDAVTPTRDDLATAGERVPMRGACSNSPSPPPPPIPGVMQELAADDSAGMQTPDTAEPDTCESSVGGGSPPPTYISTSNGGGGRPTSALSSSRLDATTPTTTQHSNPAIASVPSIELPDGKLMSCH